MSQEFNFFTNSFKKLKNKKAIICENGRSYDYKHLIDKIRNFTKLLDDEKKLIFLLGQNNYETLIGYTSFVDKGYVVALIDFRIKKVLLEKLIKLYSPHYIFCEKKFKIKQDYFLCFNFKSFKCLKSKNQKKIYNQKKNLMLLVSTSGSTGSPKFVKLSYENLFYNSKQIIKSLKIKKKDISITSLPFTYVYGLSVINTHILKGASIVLTNSSLIEKKFWDYIKKFKVTNFSGVPYSYFILEKNLKKKYAQFNKVYYSSWW